jgi:iron complex outermembrane receptor protein
MTLRAAVFHADWSHLQTDQYLVSGLPMTVNIGDGSNTGLEFEAVWRPDDHWQARANLLLEDPEVTRASNTFPASLDNGLPGVPSVLGSGDIRYRWALTAAWQAELSGQFAYVGRSFLTFDSNASSRMGDYGVGRLSASVTSTDLRLTAYLDNVTDERGDSFAFGNPFSRTRALQSTPLRPRTLGLSVTRSF